MAGRNPLRNRSSRLWLRKCDLGMRGSVSTVSQFARHTAATASSQSAACQAPQRRYAVVGGGFAGAAVAWHLLATASAGRPVQLDLYDAFGLGAGGSGAAAGLLHPYTPRGKLLWRGLEAFQDAVDLVAAAEAAAGAGADQFVWRHGLLRPARSLKQATDMARAAAQVTGAECVERAQMAELVPGMQPSVLMHEEEGGKAAALSGAAGLLVRRGLVLHPQRYLAALWAACKQLAAKAGGGSSAQLHLQPITSLHELRAAGGRYDAAVVAAGAAVNSIRGVAGLLPLDLCQGYTLDMQPRGEEHGGYPNGAPSILGATYLAAQGERDLVVGATKAYGVSAAEAYAWCGASSVSPTSAAAAEASAALLSPAERLWAPLGGWAVAGVRSGVRALPARTQQGSLPYAGRIPEAGCWVIGGLGARGLVYHAWLGRLVAEAVVAGHDTGLPPELRRWQAQAAAKPP